MAFEDVLKGRGGLAPDPATGHIYEVMLKPTVYVTARDYALHTAAVIALFASFIVAMWVGSTLRERAKKARRHLGDQ